MVEADNKHSGLNGYVGSGRQAFVLGYTWWRQTMSIQAQIDLVVVENKC